MRASRPLTCLCVALACWGLLLPASWLQAAPPDTARPLQQPPADDVQLDRAGTLHLLALDARGVAAPGASVTVRATTATLVAAKTDAQGRLSVGPLRGGIYRVTTGGHTRSFRTWAAGTAPPNAKPVATIVIGEDVVRGQMPLEDVFSSDAFVVGGLVAAAIAIPIAVHGSRNSTPSSP